MEQSRGRLPYSERHQTRGTDYHQSFFSDRNPFRAMMWRLEQEALSEIVRDHPRGAALTLLDFACGTGRILGHLKARVASATGVDIAPSMLEVARTVAPEAEIIQADLNQQDVLGEREFDLVTAFRFFPNAEPELRRSVLLILARHLAPDGWLVFNNHKNRDSLTRRISRALGREVAAGTMSHADVEALLKLAGLRVVKVVPLGTLPASDRHRILPFWMLEHVEHWLSRTSAVAGLAQDVIYVCRRA
jgi:SAM-dependent methyltransferase